MTRPEERQPAIRVSLLPRDTNPHGTIFGGVILSYVDQAGAIEARFHGADRVVTVAMEKVVFHAPVHVGDLVSFYGELVRVGRTSITVKVVVEAARPRARATPRRVTEAEITYVNVDPSGKPIPVRRSASRPRVTASRERRRLTG
ncbi:MAG: acyl-CoA thioesterase [Acidobacteria bacterium RBG_13_68_16]|jgi:acyl-CoA thioesterase YciA|nr:MAG: acyl-CoA thioesterase [Acidobacteria bacterium RBG_13_68_16]